MKHPTYFDGPDYPDGTDAEGFPGGDQRFGIIKPTKERALQILEDLKILKKDNPEPEFEGLFTMLNYAWTAYLALKEEVEVGLEYIERQAKHIQKLVEENQALRKQISYSHKPAFRVDGEDW